jgi:hypothetical protein
VLNRLMEFVPEVKDELIVDLLKEAGEYEKKKVKRKLYSSKAFRSAIEG